MDKITSPTWVLLHPYDGEEEMLDFSYDKQGMQYQIEAFDKAAAKGLKELPPITHQRTLDAAGIMDELRKEWGLIYPQDK